MRHVFISYSSMELKEARQVRDHLEKNGIPCWMAPRDIPAGSNYTKEIPVAIRECAVFVLMLSQKAQDSGWVLKELDNAVNYKKPLLPFMLEDCILREEFAFLLTGCQRFFAFNRYNEALDLLLKRIRELMPEEKQEPIPEKKEPEQVVPEKPKAPKVPKETPKGGLICPACGGGNVIHQPKRLVTYGFVEKFYLLLFVPFALGFGLAAGFLGALLTSWGPEEVIAFGGVSVGLVGAVFGVLFGKKFVAERLRRRRIRRHIEIRPYRCETCMKKFKKSIPSE